jgi:homoserine dehydrogenase
MVHPILYLPKFSTKTKAIKAVAEAQELGFAETDPTLDMGGWDALYKIVILALHGFGTFVDPCDVFVSGITNLSADDIRFAREKGYRIKLVAQATKINGKSFNLMVMPKMVTSDEYIYNVENEYNGVIINGAFMKSSLCLEKVPEPYPQEALFCLILQRVCMVTGTSIKNRNISIPPSTPMM